MEMQPSPRVNWPKAAVAVALVLASLLVITGAWGISTAVRLSDVNDEVETLRADLTTAEDRIDSLEADLEAAQTADGSSLANGDLTNGELSLEDLLGGLLGGQGANSDEGLSGLEDLLGGLLGGEGANSDDLLGSLSDLFGGIGGSDLTSCMVGSPGQFDISQESLTAQVDDIAAAVENLRGWTFPETVSPVFVTAAEMGERVRALVAESYPPELVDFDRRLLVALGMLEPGYDLLSAQLDLLDSGVAGYYDPDTGELVVATPDSDQPLPAIDQVTLAHELIHAVTDARLGFPPDLEDPLADPDHARAALALIEGDATLGMQQFSLGALDLQDQLGMAMDPRILGAQLEAGEFPYVLSNGLQFPYLDGMNFVCSLFASGGWEAVDSAYDNVPASTAEILFPERYAAGTAPVDPDPNGAPGTGWEMLREVSFGAADLLNLFSAPGDSPEAALSDPRARVDAWGGGKATVWIQGELTAVGLALVDRGAESSPILCDSITEWEAAAFGANPDNRLDNRPDVRIVIVCEERQVRVGMAPDAETAGIIAAGRS